MALAHGVVALLLAATGCSVVGLGGSEGARPTAPSADLPSPAESLAALASLPRVPRAPTHLPAYDREAFGRAWHDVDGNGCNQRDDVLLRDAVPGTTVVARQGACTHDVLAGTWVDPYSGRRLVLDDLKERSQAQSVQIDHVVPLAEAWRSGGHRWTPDQRRSFANHLDGLLAVDGPTNMSKGDADPAAWRPRQAHQCAYAARWVQVKHVWGLGVDDSERRALTEMLDACPA